SHLYLSDPIERLRRPLMLGFLSTAQGRLWPSAANVCNAANPAAFWGAADTRATWSARALVDPLQSFRRRAMVAYLAVRWVARRPPALKTTNLILVVSRSLHRCAARIRINPGIPSRN